MKKRFSYCAIMPVLLLTLLLSGCKKESDSETTEGGSYTETIYSNPQDNQILSIDSAGRKLILMGPKDASGMPLAITQALVDADDMNPEHRMLMDFNPDGTVSQISNPKLGIMTFNYVSDTAWVIRMTLPDTLGSYQMTFNPQKVKSTGGCGCGGNVAPVAGPKRTDVINYRHGFEPHAAPLLPYRPATPKSTEIDAVITATYGNGGGFVKGLTMKAEYATDAGKKGVVQCEKGYTDGVWGYSIPDNPAPPPPAGFKGKAYALFNALCYGSLPIGVGRNAICGMFAPTGVGFAACHVIVAAYVWLCRANTAVKIGSYVMDIYTAENVTITITSQHPTLPVKTRQVHFVPASPSLPNVEFFYDAMATFADVHTDPAAPVALSGYTIVATLSETETGEVPVRLSMVGSDGYTKSADFVVGSGGSCQLSIPGAVQGVKDDITARINPGTPSLPGQVVHLAIVFQ